MQTLPEKQHIDLVLEGEVLHITLNRPHVRNAMSAEMVVELQNVFSTLDESGIRTVVIRGAEGNFCSGGDINDMATMAKHSQNNNYQLIAEYNACAGKLFAVINKASQAVITVVEGVVMGGGIGLACAADVTIALATARFALPETSLGLIPAQVAPFLRRRIGLSQARLFGVTGGPLDAVEAHRIGLVHYLANDKNELERKLTAILTQIRACAPQALASTKRLMSESLTAESDLPDQLSLLFAMVMTGNEAREGTAAFSEKRKPEWSR